ncbi:conserved hypothetical protein [Desulforapulum autotrophicum HRM2]|uniref:HEAT repeat domain-containing protein n=1 Tax=Desulforapulum autotrophicum (strain ATCC 43914 / DSM 3382 / VKM B-1955 / HRM2) TaxID=177437 RepID=C0QCA8_DESAH|nr:DVU0298 family protein [Desulforapulum autotrophicum]ACN17125.1 conserved hypothetical protein [Desulforapulum autotrophicum HRM2]
MSGLRKLKNEVYTLLARDDGKSFPDEILGYNLKRVVNPLISYIQSCDEHIRARAVVSLGQVVATLADRDMESARVVMRRLMWSLNDESGGIGWGAPESMGEIMAVHGGLAREFHRILISYVDSEGNYLEYEPLRQGAVKGLKRLFAAQPLIMAPYTHLLGTF